MNRSLVPVATIDVEGLYFYALAKKKALKERSRFNRQFKYINAVLEEYEKQFPLISDEISHLKIAIRNVTEGTPDTEGQDYPSSVNILSKTARQDAAHAVQCKKFYKTLAQAHHPDKGGDIKLFQSIANAAALGDLEFLRVQFILLSKEQDLSWRCTLGVEFWLDQAEKAYVNLKHLQGLPMFAVVSAHTSNNKERARKVMEALLLIRRTELINELNFIIKKSQSQECTNG